MAGSYPINIRAKLNDDAATSDASMFLYLNIVYEESTFSVSMGPYFEYELED